MESAMILGIIGPLSLGVHLQYQLLGSTMIFDTRF